MTYIRHYPIEWFVEKLKNKEYFSLAGFGDGEFLCIKGKKGGNSHGCDYTDALREDLIKTLNNERPHFYKGMQRILPKMFADIRPMLNGQWLDREVFGDELARGGLKPLFDQLKEMPIVIISSKEKFSQKIFDNVYYIETPRTNAHDDKERIVKEILGYGRPAVYLYACGMAAGTFVQAVHGKIAESWHIDIGHILDPFCDEKLSLSRDYLQNIPTDIIQSNI